MNCIRLTRYYYYRSLRTLKGKGVAALFWASLRKLKYLLLVTNSADWYWKDLRDPELDIKSQKPVKVIFDNKDEIIEWLKEHGSLYSWMYVPEEIKTATSEKHIFPYVKGNGDIIGYVKIGIKKVYILDYDEIIEFPDKNSFIYDTFIVPEFRGKDIAPFLLNEAIKYLKDNKFEKIWCHIPSWNTPSRRAFEKLNFQRFTNVRYVRTLTLKFFTKNPTKFLSK